MNKPKRFRLLLPIIIGVLSLLVLQGLWLRHSYHLTGRQIMTDIKDAFGEAYKKEQAYRVPIIDIVNPGSVVIESCGMEEVQIIRNCPMPDTIVYNNPSGRSIEGFINTVFVDLRERIVPMNIYCLADLFAGMLHDEGLSVYFVVERYDIASGDVLDSSLLPDKKQLKATPQATVVMEISEKEALRAVLDMSPAIVLWRMAGTLTLAVCLTVIIIICLVFVGRNGRTAQVSIRAEGSLTGVPDALSNTASEQNLSNSPAWGNNIYTIGQYIFNPARNELQWLDEIVQLNKKENAILYALCAQSGNVVERSTLLEENWGSNGIIYSRSLDTYITTLRKYLKGDSSIQIVTIKGVGYKLVC